MSNPLGLLFEGPKIKIIQNINKYLFNNFYMKKRGQFYLLAAIVIISIIIGFATIANYSKTTTSTKVYDLGEELKIESANVLDYGTYSGLDEDQMANLLEGFIEAYSEYGEIESLYFIFGNMENIVVMGYQELSEDVEVSGDVSEDFVLQIGGGIFSQEFTPSPPWKIEVKIDGVLYEFKLKPGENFYFIISLTDEGETHVYVGDE